jgi:hypothetical protein
VVVGNAARWGEAEATVLLCLRSLVSREMMGLLSADSLRRDGPNPRLATVEDCFIWLSLDLNDPMTSLADFF